MARSNCDVRFTPESGHFPSLHHEVSFGRQGNIL
jgi:hypothetical protein